MPTTDSLMRAVLIIVAVLLLVPFVMMLVTMPLLGFSHMGWAGTTGATWPWLLMWIVLLIVTLGGSYLLYKGVVRSTKQAPDAALTELRRTYARGDISTDEFEERRERLQRTE
jgi:putative membrane protein